ncbi:MAG: DUF4760 domain-containing protein [Acidobacteriota bacterium]|nr:DUF4760 domain-containing protein [Acidobacteriota bacterium]
MSNKHDSMIGIIKLYELRREETMRQARQWFADFNPNSFQDIVDTLTGENDSKLRMVATYWDMAASFVNHGAIDEQMFNDANVEHIAVFAKVEPYIAEMRGMTKNPQLLDNLEKLVMRVPNVKETMADIRERAKAKKAAREEVAAKSA